MEDTHVNSVVHSSKLTTSEKCKYKIRVYNFIIDIFIDISDNLIDISLSSSQLYEQKNTHDHWNNPNEQGWNESLRAFYFIWNHFKRLGLVEEKISNILIPCFQ